MNDNDYVDDDDDGDVDVDDDVDDVDDVVDAKSDSPVSAAGSSLTSAKTGTQPIFWSQSQTNPILPKMSKCFDQNYKPSHTRPSVKFNKNKFFFPSLIKGIFFLF